MEDSGSQKEVKNIDRLYIYIYIYICIYIISLAVEVRRNSQLMFSDGPLHMDMCFA